MNCGIHNLYIKLKIVLSVTNHVASFHVTSLSLLFPSLSPSSPAVMFGGKVIRNDSIAILRERRKQENIESKHSSTSFPCHCLYLIPMSLPLPHSHVIASTSFPCHSLPHLKTAFPSQLVVHFRKTPMHCLTVVWKWCMDTALPIHDLCFHASSLPFLACHPYIFNVFFLFFFV